MIKNLVVLISRLLLLIGVFLSTSALAEVEYGVVDAVYNQKSSIVISDSYIRMNLNMKVFDERGDESNRYGLRVGQKVKFERDERGRAHTIWIMPKAFKFPRAGD